MMAQNPASPNSDEKPLQSFAHSKSGWFSLPVNRGVTEKNIVEYSLGAVRLPSPLALSIAEKLQYDNLLTVPSETLESLIQSSWFTERAQQSASFKISKRDETVPPHLRLPYSLLVIGAPGQPNDYRIYALLPFHENRDIHKTIKQSFTGGFGYVNLVQDVTPSSPQKGTFSMAKVQSIYGADSAESKIIAEETMKNETEVWQILDANVRQLRRAPNELNKNNKESDPTKAKKEQQDILIIPLKYGVTLRHVIKNKNVTAAMRVQIYKKLLEKVADFHAKGRAHCDLKPENIIVDLGRGEVELIDYGLSQPLGTAVTKNWGTPVYMAPELKVPLAPAQKNRINLEELQYYTAASDMYALGILGALLFDCAYFNDDWWAVTPIPKVDNLTLENGPFKQFSAEVKEIHNYIYSSYMQGGADDAKICLLADDPQKRPTISEVISVFEQYFHKFLLHNDVLHKVGIVDVETIYNLSDPQVAQAFKNFVENTSVIWLWDQNIGLYNKEEAKENNHYFEAVLTRQWLENKGAMVGNTLFSCNRPLSQTEQMPMMEALIQKVKQDDPEAQYYQFNYFLNPPPPKLTAEVPVSPVPY